MSSTRHYKKKTLLKKSKNVKLTRKYKKLKIHKTRINKLKGGDLHYTEEELLEFYKKIDEFKTMDDIDEAIRKMNYSQKYYKPKEKNEISQSTNYEEIYSLIAPKLIVPLIDKCIELLNNRKKLMNMNIKNKKTIKPNLSPILFATFKKLKHSKLKKDQIRYFELLGQNNVNNYSINYFDIDNDFAYIDSIPIINIKDVSVNENNELVIKMGAEQKFEVVENMENDYDNTYTLKVAPKQVIYHGQITKVPVNVDNWVEQINKLKEELTKLSDEKKNIIMFIEFFIKYSNETIQNYKDNMLNQKKKWISNETAHSLKLKEREIKQEILYEEKEAIRRKKRGEQYQKEQNQVAQVAQATETPEEKKSQIQGYKNCRNNAKIIYYSNIKLCEDKSDDKSDKECINAARTKLKKDRSLCATLKTNNNNNNFN